MTFPSFFPARRREALRWTVGPHDAPDEAPSARVAATVPGAVQLDWARAHDWPDFAFGENFRAYDGLEDRFWTYEATLDFPPPPDGQRLFFVLGGVDYAATVRLNEEVLHEQEGMFTPIELDLTDRAKPGDRLRVTVHPAPKSVEKPKDRAQANRSCKPAVSYGWDFHPRLIPLGIWEETFLEWRAADFIDQVWTRSELGEDLRDATVEIRVARRGSGQATIRWSLLAPNGETRVAQTAPAGAETVLRAEVGNPELWWPHDHGTPALHRSVVELVDATGAVLDRHEQRLGFRRVRLVMAPRQWEEPSGFPKSRSHPPITLEVNGRALFAKGANWVSPDIFPGRITAETYRPLLTLAREANMNLLRCWGGAPVPKPAFFERCDELGLMVWQEFPLACNLYPDDPAYLRVLDQESRSIIARLHAHASVVIWCGGNELFNSWSGMTDQSLPLRLLGSNCYQLDPQRPFLPTSPVDGMGHGHYIFREPKAGAETWARFTGKEAWAFFQEARNTAYTEFGVAGVANEDVIREVIPAEELFPPPAASSVWRAHHAFGAWLEMNHLCLEVVEHYFGPAKSLEELVARGQLLQAEGYRGLYEEARRQKPTASMALCWCLNEPWPTAANCSVVSWPARPKPALNAIAEACRPLAASARIRKFSWRAGERFDPQLFWLNDLPEAIEPGVIEVFVEALDGRRWHLLSWNAGRLAANTNAAGPILQWELPELGGDRFFVTLETPGRPECASRYTLHWEEPAAPDAGTEDESSGLTNL